MTKRKVEDVVYKLAKPVIDRYNFELVEIEYKKEGADWYLRIYIDKEGGITVDDCQAVSEEVSDLLDEADPIDHSYIFEVSSPGIERPLKTERDYRKSLGKNVEVKLFSAIDGKKAIEGLLKGYTEDKVIIEAEGKTFEIEKNSIAIIKPAIKF
ncbi:MAG: ribosome maturation factor RimP [Caulobacteraceae bacterium]